MSVRPASGASRSRLGAASSHGRCHVTGSAPFPGECGPLTRPPAAAGLHTIGALQHGDVLAGEDGPQPGAYAPTCEVASPSAATAARLQQQKSFAAQARQRRHSARSAPRARAAAPHGSCMGPISSPPTHTHTNTHACARPEAAGAPAAGRPCAGERGPHPQPPDERGHARPWWPRGRRAARRVGRGGCSVQPRRRQRVREHRWRRRGLGRARRARARVWRAAAGARAGHRPRDDGQRGGGARDARTRRAGGPQARGVLLLRRMLFFLLCWAWRHTAMPPPRERPPTAPATTLPGTAPSWSVSSRRVAWRPSTTPPISRQRHPVARAAAAAATSPRPRRSKCDSPTRRRSCRRRARATASCSASSCARGRASSAPRATGPRGGGAGALAARA